MPLTRRTLLRGLGGGVLGTAAVSSCTNTGRGRRGRRRKTTPPPTASDAPDPTKPLKIGLIGTSIGLEAQYDQAITLAVGEAVTDVNASGTGVFGHDVELLDAVTVEDPSTKLSDQIEELAKKGAHAVILNVPDELLVPAISTIVSTGLLAISVTSRAMDVRDAEVNSAGLLFRLAPSDLALGLLYVKAAVEDVSSGERAGVPGRVAYIATDTMQGTSLREVMASKLRGKGGSIAVEHLYRHGKPGNLKKLATKVVKAKPALVVIDGGPESGAIAAAIHHATLDKDGRPHLDLPIRLGPYGSADYGKEVGPKESLEKAQGMHPGGPLSTHHVNMMLNVSTEMTDFSFTQQAYDAVDMIVLAALAAHSLDGTRMAQQMAAVITGGTECEEFKDCQQSLTDGSTIQYAPRMGKIEFAPDGDLRTGQLRTFDYTKTNHPGEPSEESFETPS